MTSQRPSRLMVTVTMPTSCPRRTIGLAAGSRAVRSHRRAVLSLLPVTSQWLSGLMARAMILSSCPRRTIGLAAGSWAVRSHRRAVLSKLPVTSQSVRADGEAVVCPLRARAGRPGWRAGSGASGPTDGRYCHLLPVASQWLSGLMARARWLSSCPRRTTDRPLGLGAVRSHRRAVLSLLPVTSQWPSGLMARSGCFFVPTQDDGAGRLGLGPLRSHRRAVLVPASWWPASGRPG